MNQTASAAPLTKGVAKVPVIMQMEALECGAASLAMIMAYYRKWVPLEQVRVDCGVSRDGSNMKNIYLAAKSYGMDVHGYTMELDALKAKATYPCIIHWNFNHFVVLDGFRGGKAVLNDPARGLVKVSMEEFDRSFTGIVMTFAPGEGFKPGGKRKSTVEFARRRLKGAAPAVVFVVLTTVIASVFSVVNPAMSRVFYDRLLTGRAPDWLRPFILVMLVLMVFQLTAKWANLIYSRKINGKMAIEGNATFMWKVLRLPMEFFSQRMTGDILMRQGTNASIAQTLVDTVAPLAVNTVMMLVYVVIMMQYSAVMTLVGVGSILLNFFVARYLSNRRINLTRIQMRDQGKLAATTMAGISMTETIKSAGAEAGFFRKWSGYQASVNTQTVAFARLNATIGAIPNFVRQLSGYGILFLGVILAMNGQFTLGMISYFQGLLNAFMDPAMQMVSAGQTIQEMRTQMERVEDVMNYRDDPVFAATPDAASESPAAADCAKLKGEIEVRNLTFGYSRLAEPVIRDFSMHLNPGARVAIVGSSGSGKSTVSKLITGLYQPWSGDILFDGRPSSGIPRDVFTGSVAMVDQDIVLFEDTIANNIKMWDHSIEDFEMILAARDAQIHDDIMQRPGGYNGMLNENGRDLSGGQRQRLEIARVLAQDPSVIILDEATSALDAKTEYELVKAVKNRGISCIVIAHRLSTIRDCDEIIVLEKGRVVERGTHSELFAKGGAYTELVTSE
jgi:NHLM bacteriocin system ABC transporter peptidase/ATP-binding protein